jgi:hypothetical protein
LYSEIKEDILEPRFKRNDLVYLNEDGGKEPRKQYRIVEYYLGDIPDDKSESQGINAIDQPSSDHNYLISTIEGSELRTVNESEIEPDRG